MCFSIYDKSVVKSINFTGICYFVWFIDLFTWQFYKNHFFYKSSNLVFKAITALKIIISSIKTDVTDQSRGQKKKSFSEQESVLNNAELLLKKKLYN